MLCQSRRLSDLASVHARFNPFSLQAAALATRVAPNSQRQGAQTRRRAGIIVMQ